MTNTHGEAVGVYTDRLTTAWLPLDTWKAGEIIRVRSTQLSIVDLDSGEVSIRLQVTTTGAGGQVLSFTPRLVMSPSNSDYSIVGTTLQVARVRVSF
jgi:hypothetical protein